jgi:uncharacterized membrane protein
MATWKRDFASGLIILVPILVTAYIIFWVYNALAGIPIPTIGNPVFRVAITVTVFVLLVFAVGYLMRTALGTVLERTLDDVMNQLPGLRVVYNASKMAVETALGGTDELQAPVKIETWQGLRMTAFKTGKTAADGRDILFLPTAPNITSGFVIEVEPDQYDQIDESVEDALTRILSAGFGDTNEEDVTASLLEGVDVVEGPQSDGDGGEDDTSATADETSANPDDGDD